MASKHPIRVAVTGAAGNIGYAAIFRLASGLPSVAMSSFARGMAWW